MLVGRSNECGRIDLLIGAARDGSGGALLIRGEPGVGKTALLRLARDRARGMLVLEAEGVESESELPFAGLAQLMAPLLGQLDGLPDPQRRALLGALGLGADQPSERFAAYVAALAAIADAADRAPVLALVDDVQWLDAESAEAIAFIARRVRDEPVALLMAERHGERTLAGLPRVDELELQGLAPSASSQLLAASVPGRIDDEVHARLLQATAGNPLALVESARALAPGQLLGAEPLPDPLPVGAALEHSFGARVAALPPATQRALLVAAADDSGDASVYELALDLTALEPAEAAGLIRLAEGRVEFAHPLLRSAAYYRASPAARREAHAALAGALDGRPRQRARRAWHRAAAAVHPSEDVAAELSDVAAEAQERAAPTAAARAFEAAARLSPAPDARAGRLLAAASAHSLAGRPDRAQPQLDEALACATDPLLRADVQHARAQVQAISNAPVESRALLLDEADRVEPHDALRAVAMRADAVYASTMLGEPRFGLALAERIWPAARAAGGRLGLAVMLNLGSCRILCGDAARGYPLLQEARPLLDGRGLWLAPHLAAPTGMADLWVEEFATGTASLREWTRAMRAEGALSLLPHALVALGFGEYWLGDWNGARAHGAEALALTAEVRQPVLVPPAETLLALLDGAQGRFAEARGRLARAEAMGVGAGAGSITTMAGWARGRVELAAGEHDAAIAVLEPTGRFTLERGVEEPGVAPWAQDLAEAYVRAGAPDEAERTLAILEAQADRTGRRLARAGALRCRGLLADDDREADAHFCAALELHDAVPCPFERARTELCRGERLRRARRRGEARAPLRRALEAFQALAAEPWAERARRELGATGERVRRRTPDTVDDLTPQELQVSLIVADGATNREAAAALFVTPKTIETHLSHVYRKLGVRSRIELAAHLSRVAAP